MGLFIREDPAYDENVRQTGFDRYKQLMSVRFGHWWKVSMIALIGLVPLAAGIVYSIGVSSVLVLIPCSLLGTVALYLFSLLLVLALGGLYWPQLVLFDQSPAVLLRNCVLFCIRYFWRVMGAGLIQLAFIAVYVLFAPWSVLLLPVVGAWYPVFLAQFLIYDQMDGSLRIEELFDEK